jgi:hypothetical protein
MFDLYISFPQTFFPFVMRFLEIASGTKSSLVIVPTHWLYLFTTLGSFCRKSNNYFDERTVLKTIKMRYCIKSHTHKLTPIYEVLEI